MEATWVARTTSRWILIIETWAAEIRGQNTWTSDLAGSDSGFGKRYSGGGARDYVASRYGRGVVFYWL